MALSIVGIDDVDWGYYAEKRLQEKRTGALVPVHDGPRGLTTFDQWLTGGR